MLTLCNHCSAWLQLVLHLSHELDGLRAKRIDFETRWGVTAYKQAEDNWAGKLARARAGEQRWGLVCACKP